MAELVEVTAVSPDEKKSEMATEADETETDIDEENRLAWPLPPNVTSSEKPEVVKEEKIRYFQKASNRKQRGNSTKNIIVLCITFVLTYTAMFNTVDLRNSLQDTSRAFMILEQSLLFISIILGLFFLSPLFVIRFGCKVTMIAGLVPFALYVTAHLYVHWLTVMPTAALLGVGIALIWTAQGVYVSRLADNVSELLGSPASRHVNILFGAFYLTYNTAYVWFALTSGFIHQSSSSNLFPPSSDTCGALHCPNDITNFTAPFQPTTTKLYTLRTTSILLSVLAIITLCVCLSKTDRKAKQTGTTTISKTNVIEVKDEIIGESSHEKTSCRQLLFFATFYQLCTKQQMMLVPLTVYGGLQLSFFLWDINQSYANCSLGYWMAAMTTLCWGCSVAVFSLIFGRIVSISGRIPLFTFGALLQCGILLGLFLWLPNQGQTSVFFVISALWGVGEAVWQCLLNGLYAEVSKETSIEAGFANFHLWRTVGLIIAYIYGHFVSTYIKIFILLCSLILGMAGYFAVEVPIYRRNRS